MQAFSEAVPQALNPFALRACLVSRRARPTRHISRHTALFCLEIHQVFPRQTVLSGEKSAARPAHCGILNRLLGLAQVFPQIYPCKQRPGVVL